VEATLQEASRVLKPVSVNPAFGVLLGVGFLSREELIARYE
jgi:hypothetical protein